jgi:hypothetical protein
MPVNTYQKIITVDINASTKAFIDQKLQEGFVIQMIVNLNPTFTKLLIVYATPPVIEPEQI